MHAACAVLFPLTASGAVSREASVTRTVVAAWNIGACRIHVTEIIKHGTLIDVCGEKNIFTPGFLLPSLLIIWQSMHSLSNSRYPM